MRIGCVLMAAGTASRFGGNKLLYAMDGRSLLEWTMRAVPASLFARAVAVVSDDRVAGIARTAGYETIYNPAPELGQGGSIVLGTQAMTGLDAALYCVGDQPFLTRESVERLLAAWEPGLYCALSYSGKRGNPVLFSAEAFPALLRLAPGETGRIVLAQHMDKLRLVAAGNTRELSDIDTRADLPPTGERGDS